MDGKDLGKTIRAIRLEKKMTQSEVVGTFITRNMLSKIESGTAVPSLATLDYLAKSLNVPLASLLPDDSEDGAALLIKAKDALKREEWKEATRLADQLPAPFLDEGDAICAKAYLLIAKEHLAQKEFAAAVQNAKQALERAKKGVYASRELQTEALLILDAVPTNEK